MLNIGSFLTITYDHRAVTKYEQYEFGIDFFTNLSKIMPYPERPYINNLFNGVRDLTKEVKDELISDANGKKKCKEFVMNWLIKQLQTATIFDMLDKFMSIVNADDSISEKQKKSLEKNYISKDYGKFLSDLLIYAISKPNIQYKTSIPLDELEFVTDCNQMCSLCGEPLRLYKAKKTMYRYSIIQIFPEGLSAENEVEFNSIKRRPTKLNHKNNKICVCDTCGDNYAASPIAETYRKLCDRKDAQLRQNDTVATMHTSELDEKVSHVLGKLNHLDFDDNEYKDLRTIPLTIKEKIANNENLRKKINDYAYAYYHYVRRQLSELDDAGFNFKIIANQFQNFYFKLEMTGTKSQETIYYDIVEWIIHKFSLSNDYRTACEIVVAFFVQNCEVFHAISK